MSSIGHLVPPTVWSKFEFDLLKTPYDTGFENFTNDDCKCKVIHDCMWAGHCSNHLHNDDDFFNGVMAMTMSMPVLSAAPISTPHIANSMPSPKSVLKVQTGAMFNASPIIPPNVRGLDTTNSNTTSNSSSTAMPQTPPMSDDEDAKDHTRQLLKMFKDEILGDEFDEDELLIEYLKEDIEEEFGVKDEGGLECPNPNVDDDEEDDEDEDDEEEEEEDEDGEEDSEIDDASALENVVYVKEEPGNNETIEAKEERLAQLRARQNAAQSDHSYHKGTYVYTRVLGLETPSDSEEEIDVVSVGDKHKKNFSLPTNPTIRMRDRLQKTVATAITYNRNYGSDDNQPSMMGVGQRAVQQRRPRSPSPQESSTTRAGGIKRMRTDDYLYQPQSTSTSSRKPYGRRYNHHHHHHHNSNNQSSDSEPSSKRNLHNNMERQRRIDLRNQFENLKSLVPEVCKKQRAPKVQILRAAAQYCQSLRKKSKSMRKSYKELDERNDQLKDYVNELRKDFEKRFGHPCPLPIID